jgi:hypothetical protein
MKWPLLPYWRILLSLKMINRAVHLMQSVPEFIEFIVKDIPSHQLPMRGGLKWLDMQCLNRYGNTFVASAAAQQTEL